MPIIYRCDNCEREEVAGEISGWYTKMLLGGTQVLCPKCGAEKRKEDIEEEIIQRLARGDKELEKQIRKKREEFIDSLLEEKIKRCRDGETWCKFADNNKCLLYTNTDDCEKVREILLEERKRQLQERP